MRRVLVVDDSPSVRSLLATRLRGSGFDVDEAIDGEAGAEQAIAAPPDLVVTDLIMKGLSGVQLCRILRSDPATAHVPVVLLTGSGDKRSRFWARSAGAAAYLSKDRLDDLVGILTDLVAQAPTPPPVLTEIAPRPRRTLNERMSAVLDSALFDSVIAGEVRSLATCGTLAKLFEKLVTLVSDLINYRWLAIVPVRSYAPLFVHANPEESEAVVTEARSALGLGPERSVEVVSDPRAIARSSAPLETMEIVFAGEAIGRMAVAPTSRGLSKEDRRVLLLVATELGGSLQMSALYEDAQRLATTDALTGMLNRRAFLELIERERLRSDRHGFPFSLMLLDIDHFKTVNDTRGHAAGDAVLKGVASVLNAVARRTDLVARWGGEEFVVALPQTREAGARIAGERVRRAVAEAAHRVPGGEAISVTASVGISSGDAPWSQDALLAAADAAMYAAKARGRNRVEALAPSHSPGSTPRVKTATTAK